MSDTSSSTPSTGPVDPPVQPEVITPDQVAPTRPDHLDRAPGAGTDGQAEGSDVETTDEPTGDAVTEPGKVMRIGSMIKQLLEEVRASDLDEASRERLAEVYERSVTELSTALSPDLQEELLGLTLPFESDEAPSEAEIRVAKAQLVGWLEGLFHGIQASLMAQQFAAQQQLQQMRELPGQAGQSGQGGRPSPQQPPQTGTYL